MPQEEKTCLSGHIYNNGHGDKDRIQRFFKRIVEF